MRTFVSPDGRYVAGDYVPSRTLAAISGEEISLPYREGLTHIQFRRFAGCPFCNLHLRSITARHAEIQSAGINEVVLFHSSAEDLLEYNEPTPFPVIADPHRALYREFGVEPSWRSLAHPRAWGPMLRGVVTKRSPLKGDHGSGHMGLPADFLIDADGTVIAAKYGTHAYDQWSVDELLEIAATSAQ